MRCFQGKSFGRKIGHNKASSAFVYVPFKLVSFRRLLGPKSSRRSAANSHITAVWAHVAGPTTDQVDSDPKDEV